MVKDSWTASNALGPARTGAIHRPQSLAQQPLGTAAAHLGGSTGAAPRLHAVFVRGGSWRTCSAHSQPGHSGSGSRRSMRATTKLQRLQHALAAAAVLACLTIQAGASAQGSAQHERLLADFRAGVKKHCSSSRDASGDSKSAPVLTQWRLEGAGAHRQLIYELDVRDAGACGERGGQLVQVHIAQPLPVELFVDPYQLSSVARLSQGQLNFSTFGPLDLESPAPRCEPTLVGVHVDVQVWRRGETQPHGDAAHSVVRVAVPVHSRYPAPVQESGEAKYAGHWWAALASGTTRVALPAPTLALQCGAPAGEAAAPAGSGAKGQRWCGWQEASAALPLVEWEVPAGSLEHAETVSLFTTIAATTACVALLAVLFRERLQDRS